jgi:hypothetical protein
MPSKKTFTKLAQKETTFKMTYAQRKWSISNNHTLYVLGKPGQEKTQSFIRAGKVVAAKFSKKTLASDGQHVATLRLEVETEAFQACRPRNDICLERITSRTSTSGIFMFYDV